MADPLADGNAAPPEPVVIKDAQGTPYTVDASELDTYLRSGEGYSIAPSHEQANEFGQVPIQTPTGGAQLVSPEEAQARIQSFEADAGRTAAALQAEDEARYGGALQGARAASAGWLRGLTMGLSDQALTRIDPSVAQDLAGLQQYRGGLSTAGELAGMAAPLLASGGTGALASGARGAGFLTRGAVGAGELAGEGAAYLARTAGFAEGGLAARTAASAARGAIEVGLMEAGREVSQAAIQQRELEAGKVMSAFGHGALIGGALMGGGTAAWGAAKGLGGAAASLGRWGTERLISKGEQALQAGRSALTGAAERAEGAATDLAMLGSTGGKTVKERALEFAQEKQLQSTGGTARQLQEIAEASPALRAEADRMLTQEIPKVLGKAEGAVIENTARREAIAKIRDKVGEEIGAAIRAIDAAGVVSPNLRAISDEARIQLLAPIKANVFAKKDARAIEALINDFREYEGGKMTFEGLKDLSSKLNDVIKKSGNSSHLEEMQKFRGMMEAEIDRGAREAGEKIGNAALAEQYAKAKLRYATASMLEGALETGARSAGKASTLDLMGAVTSNVGASMGQGIGSVLGPVGSAVGGVVGGVAGAVASNIKKRFGDQIASNMLRAYARGDVAPLSRMVDQAVSKSISGYLTTAYGMLPKATASSATGGSRALSAGSRVVASQFAQETQIGQSLFGEPVAKRSTTGKPEQRQVQAAAPARRGDVSDQQVRRAVEKIQASAEQQRAALERIAEMAPHLAPEIRGQLAASKRAHDYILSKIPQSSNLTASLTPQAEAPRMTRLTPQAEAPRMTRAQRDELLTAVRVVSDPLSVLDSLEKGTVSRAEVDALKATAPEVYQQIRTEVQAQLDARAEPLPYKKALNLSLLLGVVGHPSLDPAAIRSVQQALGPQQVAQAQPTAQPSAPKRVISRAGDWSVRKEEA